MEVIKFKYKVTEEDYIRLNLWSVSEKSRILYIFNKYVIYVLGVFLLTVCYIAHLSASFYGLVIIMTLLPLFMRILTKKNAKKLYRSNKKIQENEIETTLSDEGVEEKLGENQTTVKWEDVFRIYETHDMIIIMTDSIHVSAIRKRLLTENQISAMKETIVKKIPSKAIKSLKV